MISLPTFRGVLSGFNPLSLSPALWLNDTGSDPSVWTDMSGNGRNASQADPAKRPSIVTNALNGKQVRRFNGTGSFLGSVWSSVAMPITSTFVVFKWDGGGGGSDGRRCILETRSVLSDVFRPSLYILAGASPQKMRSYYDESLGTTFTDSISTIGTLAIMATAVGNAGTSIFLNGIFQSAASGGATGKDITGVNIGTHRAADNRWFSGDIAEILIFPTALSTVNRQRVERYLSGKYAIAF